MKKLLVLVLLLACTAPMVTAEVLTKTPKVAAIVSADQKASVAAITSALEHLKVLPKTSQKLINGFFVELEKTVQKTKLRHTVLPEGIEDTEGIDAILPFITAVKQNYYDLASQDAQAAQFVGNWLYVNPFRVKNGTFTIPEFIVKYRSYAETRTDLDAFYNDIFADAEAYKNN